MYGALVTAVDSLRGSAREWTQATFGPRTAAPSTATLLRSVLWPIAILSVIHRSIVLTTNGNITDDFKPVYRAVLNFRHGWDIYSSCAVPPLIGYLDSGQLPATDTYCPA